jgi:lambda family phage portal protein
MKWWPFNKRVPKKAAVRMYEAARQSRLTADWYSSNTSEDAELSQSLRMLRQRGRALVRDNPYGKRVKQIVVANVVGHGIGMQAGVVSTRNRLNNRVNDEIEAVWREWCRPATCHTGGVLHFADLERMLMGQVVEAGEIFVRKHYGDGTVPLRLEVIEPERMAEDYEAPEANGTVTKLGIEQDKFGRPLAYWIRELHPGEIRRNMGATDKLIRVPAEQMIHLRIVDRWPQTRGVSWFHSAAKRLRDMDGYTEAEIVAARMSASYMGFIQSPEVPVADDTVDGQKILEFEGGIIQHLAPGEQFQGFAPNRPNAQLDPFMRYMLREVASSVGVSYESLSRDYSQSNYSSSRLALLDDRDLWRTLQQWFIRSFREPLHREWLGLAVLAGALPSIPPEQYLANRAKFEAVQFKPRGWGWVDPTKEVAAYKEAVLAGFTTVSDVIAATGNGADLEDVLNGRRRELDMMAELDLEFDTEFEKPEEPQEVAAPEPEPEPEPDDAESDSDRAIRALTQLVGQLIAAHQAPPSVTVNIPAGAIQAHVTVEPTEVRIEDGAVQVSMHPAAIHMPAVEVSNVVPFPHAEPAQIELQMPFRVLDDEPTPEVADEPTDETAGAAA